eukprot:1682507-Amphidinium_carterae.1
MQTCEVHGQLDLLVHNNGEGPAVIRLVTFNCLPYTSAGSGQWRPHVVTSESMMQAFTSAINIGLLVKHFR